MNPQSGLSEQAAQASGAVAQEAYGVGIPALKGQIGYLNDAMATGGEPQYMQDAFAGQRTSLLESGILGGQARQGQGPVSGSLRVMRGGSWSDYGSDCRSAVRAVSYPPQRNLLIGFRVVLAPGVP